MIPESINTEHRTIKTQVPHPGDLAVIERITRHERSSMESQLPLVWDRAEGYQVYDRWGNRFIDLSSSIFVTNTGHANPMAMERLSATVRKPLLHSYCYPTVEKAELLETMAGMLPGYLDAIRLVTTGTEATELAIRIARLRGMTFSRKKNVIVGGTRNFHGKTLAAVMSAGTAESKSWIGYHDPNMHQLPFPYPWLKEVQEADGETLFNRHLEGLWARGVDPETLAAFIFESYQGWGAVFYPPQYIQAMRKWCSLHDCLLIADEIQAGFGRAGTLFCYQHYDVEPDIVTCGKGLSGHLPLSALLGRSGVVNVETQHSSTHGGHVVACAAAVGNLRYMVEHKLVERAKEMGPEVQGWLAAWQAKFPDRITRIIGKGLVWAVYISKKGSDELDVELTDEIIRIALQKGVFSIRTGCGTIKIGPPLNIPGSALKEAIDVYVESMGKAIENH